MDGASAVEDTWLRARAGEHGYLSGKDAEAIACDAMIVPVVTGSPDWDLITEMITLITDAYGHAAHAAQAARARPGQTRPARQPGGPGPAAPGPQPLPPEAWEALQYALARRAIRFVSGPGALASALRRSLLGNAPQHPQRPSSTSATPTPSPTPSATPSSPATSTAPGPAAATAAPPHCDVHHVNHKKDGGNTSITDCVLLCQYHHDICIHRLGWTPRAPARRIHPRHQPRRQTHPPQPPTTTANPTRQLTPTANPEPGRRPTRRITRPPRPALNANARDRQAPPRPRAPARPDTTRPAFDTRDEPWLTSLDAEP